MSIDKDIKQRTFRNEYQRAIINVIFTYNWTIERLKYILDKEDLTMQQFNILRILRGSQTPLSTLQIRDRMLDKMSDTSRIVDRLVLKTLAKKVVCKTDKRLVDVTISEKGRKILNKIDLQADLMDNLYNSLSIPEAKKLNKLLDKIRQSH
jgi:DNA-binding MarR family transcriptional regulator